MKNWKYHFSKCLAVAKVSQKHNSNNENKNICYNKIYVSQWFDILMNTEWNFSFILWSIMKKPFSDLIFENFSLNGNFKLSLSQWRLTVIQPIRKRTQFENPPHQNGPRHAIAVWIFLHQTPNSKIFYYFKILYFQLTSSSLPVNFRFTSELEVPIYRRWNFDILKNSCASILLEIFSVPGNFDRFQRVKVLYRTYSSKWPFPDDK